MTLQDDEIVREFLVESHENLDRLDHDIVALEAEPDAVERIAAIFRTVHTVKGTAGFLGFARLEALAHAGENLLAKLRDGALAPTPALATILLRLFDRVRAHLRSIEAGGGEDLDSDDDLTGALNALANGDVASPSLLAEVAAPVAAVVAVAPAPSPLPAAPTPAHAVAPPVVAVSSRDDDEPELHEAPVGRGPLNDTSVRVDVRLLDRLMNLVGELVLARNRIVQIEGASDAAGFVGAAQRLSFITSELQEGVMKTRMQPIGNVWAKLPRVIRDLSTTCGKQVRIEMIGKDTDLDRTIIEAIKDPLTHIVRNAVDHGIETPSVRVARGKPRTGTLTLRAFHEGGQVHIEIADDGGGIGASAVRARAVQRGMITAERAAQLSERELHQLLFLPGFSTAEKVSSVSGRGVGMDVVKTNVESIGGTIELTSTPEVGTTIRLKIPLTLAIVPALIVTAGGQRFAIPQVNLLELVRLDHDATRGAIEHIHGTPLFRLRGTLLPLVSLADTLRLPSAPLDDDALHIVVLQADGRQFGLVVDSIEDSEEIVVKPLGRELKSLAVYAGATIMGDGGVALILDINGVARRASVVSGVRERAVTTAVNERADVPAVASMSMLVFRVGPEAFMAMPLAMVARLEEVEPARIERAGRAAVLQYRGTILPLVTLGDTSTPIDDSRGTVAMIVASADGHSVGFLVAGIVDIVEEQLTLHTAGARAGVLGTAIIQERVLEVLDVASFFERASTGRAA
ncbi:MAG TPA: chemotaxis protein CheW [Myxococcota bacterium]